MTVSFLSPMEAYGLWAAEYPAQAHNPLMLAEERAVLTALPQNLHGRTVLDAGCGSGRYMAHALHRGAGAVIGIDMSPEMLARARQEIDTESPESRCRLARASVGEIPLASSTADVAICALTLGHLPDLVPPLAELKRITRPNGLVICTDMHPIGAERGWVRTFTIQGRKYAVQHVTHTLQDWSRACAAVGLQVVEMVQPSIDPADVPPGARFDAEALNIPAVVIFSLRGE